MSLSGTIIVKKKGFEVPLDFLKLALSNNKTCSGFALISKHKAEDAVEQLLGQSRNEPSDLDKITKLQSQFKDKNLVMYFGSSNTALAKGAAPPYPVLLDKDGKPLILAFLDGDCSQFHQADSSNPDIFFAVQKDLKPRMQEWYEDADGDLTKVVEKLTKSATKRADLERLFKGKGALCLYTRDDEIKFFHSVAKNDYQDFEWGSASNTYGWKVKGVTPVSPEKETVAGPFSVLGDEDDFSDGVSVKEGSKSGGGGDNPPAQPQPQPQVDDNPKSAPVAEPETRVMSQPAGTVKVFCQAPANWKAMDQNNRKGWLSRMGYPGKKGRARPEGWNSPDFPGITDYVKLEALNKFRERGFQEVKTEGSVPTVGPKSAAGGKDITPKHVPQASVSAPPPKAAATMVKHAEADDDFGEDVGKDISGSSVGVKTEQEKRDAVVASLHLFPVEMRQDIDKWLKQNKYATFVGHNSAKLEGDPRTIRVDESNIEDFFKQCGINLEDSFGWPLDMLVDLGEEFGLTALAMVALAYRSAYYKALAEEGKEKPEQPETVVEQPKKNKYGFR